MSQEQPHQPTASELEVLQLLWDRGPLSVKEVHAVLSKDRPIVYTTVLKTLQVMLDRELVRRESQGRKHIYQAAIAKKETEERLLDSFLERTFGGSAKRLVMSALGNLRASRQDIEELKAAIDKLETRESEEE